jgi:hypothetical protein
MGATVTSFTGLQNLTNIQEFKADYNSLTSIDLSGMSTLTLIDVSDNDVPDSSDSSLTSVNLSGCTSLQFLYLDDSNFSEFPDLSDCTSLEYIDFDQAGLVGSVDVSNLPALTSFDFSGNTALTELIISSTQPLGTGEDSVDVYDCALTQTAVDNILVALASGSVSNGSLRIDNANDEGTNANPGLAGREAIFILDSRGWSVSITPGNHIELTLAYEILEADVCASSNTNLYYITDESSIVVGNKLYTNSDAWNPADDGWYRLDGDGSIKFEVSGSGEIISVDPCGV